MIDDEGGDVGEPRQALNEVSGMLVRFREGFGVCGEY